MIMTALNITKGKGGEGGMLCDECSYLDVGAEWNDDDEQWR